MLEINNQNLERLIELRKLKFDFSNEVEINQQNLEKLNDNELKYFIEIVLRNSNTNKIPGINPISIQNSIINKISLWVSKIISTEQEYLKVDFQTLVENLIVRGLLTQYELSKEPYNLEPVTIKYVQLSDEAIQLINETNFIKTT